MTELTNPNLTRKKRQKLIKELWIQIENEVKELKEEIDKSSPLRDYWKTHQKKEDRDNFYTLIGNKEERWKDEGNKIKNNPDKWENEYRTHLTNLIKFNKGKERGIPSADLLDKRRAEIIEVFFKINCVNVKAKIKWIKRMEDNNLLDAESFTNLKRKFYSNCDALQSNDGRIMTELCMNNNFQTIVDVLEEEIRADMQVDSPNLADHLTKEDNLRLREILRRGELTHLYRGFLVKEDEYVRQGKKDDGEKYWLQDAGKGISYSLDRNVAGFFTSWYLGNDDSLGKLRDNTDDYKTWLRFVPPQIITKQDFIEEWSKIISKQREILQVKPIICKFLIDPSKIKSFDMGTESEINLLPEDVVVERYVIPTSVDIATCVYDFKLRYMNSWVNYNESIFNPDGIVALPRRLPDAGIQIIFADGKVVNEKIKKYKDIIKEKCEKIPYFDWSEFLLKTFTDAAVDIPEDVVKIKPFTFCRDTFNLLTNKHNIDFKSRRGRVYTWSGTYIRSILNIG
tara:strand:+ start:3407 stop:4939 length:1533 start_codon:yes stop_codon:yes gene_type:complete